jgi:hypothetical protein
MIYPTEGIKLGDGKTFDWNSSEDGKRDWSRFYPRLKMLLGDKSWVTSEREIESQSAGEPPRPPPRGRGGAAPDYEAVEKHRERYGRWKLTVQKIDQAFYFAIATLRGLFDPGCMASHQIEQALIVPAGADDDDWPPARSFKAAMDMLKETYSASTEADVAALRLELEQFSDQVPGGFTEYHRNFVRVLTQLRATKADAVSDSELTTWVKRAIKNDLVNNSLLLRLYVDKPGIKYDRILAKVTQLLVELGNQDKDPYRGASGAKGPVAAHVAKTADGVDFGGCTKCWGTGHWFRACAARQCQVCKAPLGKSDRSCPRWKSHPVGFRFYNDVAPWDRVRGQSSNGGSGGGYGKRKAESSGHSGGGDKRSHYEAPKTDPSAELDRLKKALKVARKKAVKANKAAKRAAAAQGVEED